MTQMSFREYLEGHAAYPFRPAYKTPERSVPMRSNRDLPRDERLRIGLRAEDLVIDALNRVVGPTWKSTRHEDIGDKIDAHVTNSMTGETVTAQIKARESGDDIIVEWYRQYPSRPGRDRGGRSQLYVVMDSGKEKLFLIPTKVVHETAARLVKHWEDAGRRESWDRAGKVKLVPNQEAGGDKLVVYLNVGPLLGSNLPGWPAMIRIPSATTDSRP